MAIQLGKTRARILPLPDGKPEPTLYKSLQTALLRWRRPVGHKEMLFFFSQLSLMLEVGTPLTDALRVTASQTKNSGFADIIGRMVVDIEEGRQFSNAMSRHPETFKPVMVSMVHAGETGGFLKEIIDRLIDMQEKHQALVAQVKSAVTYPVILCLLGVVVVIFVLMGVLPKFMMFFEGKEHVLPLTTRCLICISRFLRDFWHLCVAGAIGAALFLRFLISTDPVRGIWDKVLIRTPYFARMSNKIYTSQLIRTLGSLLASQVPLLEALHVTQNTFQNRYYREFVGKIRAHVEQGGSFAYQFGLNPYILESVRQMISVGEGVGNLSAVMLRLADFYDEEVRRDLQALASLIEPLALILMGIVVGVIVASVILPMFRLASALK